MKYLSYFTLSFYSLSCDTLTSVLVIGCFFHNNRFKASKEEKWKAVACGPETELGSTNVVSVRFNLQNCSLRFTSSYDNHKEFGKIRQILYFKEKGGRVCGKTYYMSNR